MRIFLKRNCFSCKLLVFIALISVSFNCANAKLLGKISIDEIITKITKDDPTIRISNLNIDENSKQIKLAKANYYPEIVFKSQVGYGQTLENERGESSAGIYLNQLVYDSGKTRSEVDLLRVSRMLSRQNRTIQKEKLSQNALSIFVLLGEKKNSRDLFNKQLNSLTSLRGRLKNYIKLRIATRFDVAKLETAIEKVRSDLIFLESEIQILQFKLEELLGIEISKDAVVVDKDLISIANVISESKKWSMRCKNPFLKKKELYINYAKQQRTVALAKYRPVVSFNAQAIESVSDFEDAESEGIVSLNLRWPLYDGGGRGDTKSIYSIRKNRARVEFRHMRQKLRLHVRSEEKTLTTLISTYQKSIRHYKKINGLWNKTKRAFQGGLISIGEWIKYLNNVYGLKRRTIQLKWKVEYILLKRKYTCSGS